MTAIIGNDGAITMVGGHAAIVRSWRARFPRTIVEVTGFTDTALRRNRAGLVAIEGSAVATPDTTSAIGATTIGGGGTVGFILALTAARTFTFQGLMSNVAPESDKNGQAVVTFDFVNGDSNTFTESW